MRALLERELQAGGLSFADWTVLVFTATASPAASEVVQRQLDGHLVPTTTEAQRTIERLVEAGLIVHQKNLLAHTGKGTAVFSMYRDRAKGLAQALYGDLPAPDLVATQRTLMEIAARANKLLKTNGGAS